MFKIYLFILAFIVGTLKLSAHADKRKKKKFRSRPRKSVGYRAGRQLIDSTLWSSKLVFDSLIQSQTDSLLHIAETFLGVPYRYAGTDPRGFDCSGFVLYCFKRVGINLPHHSGAQMYLGRKIQKSEAQPGDIIYFGYINRNRRRYISHSGIIHHIENGNIFFIHSATHAGIRIDCLEQTWYKRRFMGINRVIQ